MAEKLTFEQAINQIDRIIDNEKKLLAKINETKQQLEKLEAQRKTDDFRKTELKTILQSYLSA